jgi:predicted SprT family Zn-dependent metalloprotease
MRKEMRDLILQAFQERCTLPAAQSSKQSKEYPMQCKYCGDFNEQVFRTKEIDTNEVIRIRVCFTCGAKLPTRERIDIVKMKKINPDRKLPDE